MIKDNIRINQLTCGRLLAHNIVVNLIGQIVPMIIAFFAIPILIKNLGTDRFGILTLAWVVVGYFSIFDLGLGRALTKLVAEAIGKGQIKEISGLIRTSLAIMGGMGIVGLVFLMLLTPWLVDSVLNIPLLLRDETIIAFYLLAISVPFVIISTGLSGVLEAHQRFDLVNTVRFPLGILTFLGPLALLPFSHSLVSLVSTLVVGRIVALVFFIFLCFRVVPTFREKISISGSLIKSLLSFGGWLTVSNIVGPFMLYADRFFIATMISVSAVAYYTVPFEVIIKLLIIPSAIMGVMFPAYTSSFANNSQQLENLYQKTMMYMLAIMLPFVLLIVLFTEQGLTLWLNADFAHTSFRVAQFLAIGVLINSFGLISQGLIQSMGRPDITAKLHLVEFPLYVGYLMLLLLKYGINGVACAWLIRVTISAIALAFIANRLLIKNKINIEGIQCKQT